MLSIDGTPDRRAKVIGAAHAAASWARARRAAWTDTPLTIPRRSPSISEDRTTRAEVPPTLAMPPAPPPLVVAPGPPQPVRTEIPDAGPSAFDRAVTGAQSLGASVGGLLPSAKTVARIVAISAVAAIAAAAIAGGVYLWMIMPATVRDASPPIKPAVATESRPTAGSDRPVTPTGSLRVDSTPTGARVLVDGRPRGVTPLTLDLPAGSHVVELDSAAGRIRRSVTIAGGQAAAVNELIFAGWLAVYAPFDLTITEGDRSLRLDDRNQVMLPAGPHDLRVVNQALGYEAVHHVELKPGDVTTLSVTPPRSPLTVTATESAEVWLDGARVGETPLAALPVDLGTHEVVLKRAGGAERRFTVTVTVQPFTLNVDFSKPGI